jgi:hypothetical protein
MVQASRVGKATRDEKGRGMHVGEGIPPSGVGREKGHRAMKKMGMNGRQNQLCVLLLIPLQIRPPPVASTRGYAGFSRRKKKKKRRVTQ